MASSLFQNQNNQPSKQQMLNNSINEVKQMTEGKNPQAVFLEECKRRGVDANTIISLAQMFK